MKIRFGHVLLTAIAAGVGIVTLLGYFVEANPSSPLTSLFLLRVQLVGWASLLAGVAVLIGALNLARVHTRKMLDTSPGWFYSLFLILTFAGVLLFGLIAPLLNLGTGAANGVNGWVYRYIQTAVGTALAALLVFFLVLAGFRLMRRRPSVMSITFLIVAVLALAGLAPAPAGLDFGQRELWIGLSQVIAASGARGLLLGIALGTITTGLRILMALDRPYGD